MRTLGLALVVTCALTLAACDDGPDARPTTAPPATTAPATTPPEPTGTTPATTPGTTPATTVPATTPPTTGPTTSGGPPDPRAVPLDTLLRPGTRPLRALYGDLNGDGTDDIALASVDGSPPPNSLIAQAYLDVFLSDGSGGWPKAWEATGPAPGGAPGAPPEVVQPPSGVPAAQQLDFLAIVDMDHDGSSELAAGVLNVGAGPGPLDVWVLGFAGGTPRAAFWEQTVQGGILVAAGDALRLQTPAFSPGDPACCPSRIEHQTIGFDPERHRVRVLERTFTPVS